MLLSNLKSSIIYAFGALAVLQAVTGRPTPPPFYEDAAEREVGVYGSRTSSDSRGLETSFQHPRDGWPDDLYTDLEIRRGGRGRGQIRKEPKKSSSQAGPHRSFNANKEKKKPYRRRTGAAAAAAQRPGPGPKALPLKSKIQLGDHAREELNKMGLRGKARRNAVKQQKQQIKKEMRKNPALQGTKHAKIAHVAHKGGSDPKEPNHITAVFSTDRKMKGTAKNKFNGGDHHHVYVNRKGLSQQAKAAQRKNDAFIAGKPKAHQTSVGKTRTQGKSSQKGKGKRNKDQRFSPREGIQAEEVGYCELHGSILDLNINALPVWEI